MHTDSLGRLFAQSVVKSVKNPARIEMKNSG